MAPGYLLRWVTCLLTRFIPAANEALRRAATLIKTTVLPPSQTVTYSAANILPNTLDDMLNVMFSDLFALTIYGLLNLYKFVPIDQYACIVNHS